MGQNFAVAATVSRVAEAFLVTAGVLIGISFLADPDSIISAGGLVIPLLTALAAMAILLATGFYPAVTAANLHVSFLRVGIDTTVGFVLAVIASGQLAKYDVVKIYPYRWQWTLGLTALWLVCVVARRAILNLLLEKGWLTRKIIVVGDASDGAKLQKLSRLNSRRFVVTASVPATENMFSRTTAALAAKLRVPEIVVCTSDTDRTLPGAADFIRKWGVSVVDFESFYERETGKVDLTNLPEAWPYAAPALRVGFALRAAKRAFDVAASLLAIAATAPVMALTAIAIRIEDGKPSLFRQTRVGLNGREFTLYKFRSMRIDAENGSNPVWASENDTRITRVGSVIRKFRIDELPQFYNTLRGEMSFIGPRPERPYFVQQLEDQIPCYAARHTVKPGITGWAQVSYHYGASFEDAFEKTAYDLYYVKHQSLFLDISIILRTVKVILWPRGVR